MTITRKQFLQGAAAAAGTVAIAPGVFAQDYPSQNFLVVCGFPPGSGADIFARYFAEKIRVKTGKNVVVENKVGANSNIATTYVARSKPDGYTILITPGNATLASAPHLFKDVAFDPIKSFEPVARLARVPFVMIVKPDSPVNSVAELTALLKSKGPKARYGASTNTAVITAELYAQMAGLQIERINYNAVADAMRGLLADEFDFAAYDATWVAGMAQAGRVKPIGVTSTERSSALPKVPTLAESGFPSFNLTPWWGAVVPAGTPKPIVDKLSGWFAEITNSQDTKEFMGKLATETWAGGPDDLRQLIASELEAWGKYIALAKIEKQ